MAGSLKSLLFPGAVGDVIDSLEPTKKMQCAQPLADVMVAELYC